MKEKKISLQEICDFLGEKVLRISGNIKNIFVDNLADAVHVTPTTLDWIIPSKSNKQDIAKQSKARVLLVDETIVPIEGKILIHVKSPKLALALIGNHFFVEKWIPEIHPTAIVHPDAHIGENCYIGPYAVIGKAVIGNHTYIDSHVRIYDDVNIGHDCVIKAGVVLGGAGFGFERDESGNKFRFPQIGGLIISDFVEVGANTCIDRGALSDTVIGNYTKINNLCHIAHNNQIGQNVTIAGCVNISGSCVIEDNVWISPNVSLRGFNHLGESCMVGTGAVVTKDIPAGETWVGNPARIIHEKN